uniref:Uncharacterized protein n=1 Tax=Babesia bovis TaxID=5865 RepID=S6BFN1_BABBO|nr:hypothetical protein [Babesia bovis]
MGIFEMGTPDAFSDKNTSDVVVAPWQYAEYRRMASEYSVNDENKTRYVVLYYSQCKKKFKFHSA